MEWTHKHLPAHAAAALQFAQRELKGVASAVDTVELQNLGQTAKDAQDAVDKMETTLSGAEIESALETITDIPLDTGRLEFSIRELKG